MAGSTVAARSAALAARRICCSLRYICCGSCRCRRLPNPLFTWISAILLLPGEVGLLLRRVRRRGGLRVGDVLLTPRLHALRELGGRDEAQPHLLRLQCLARRQPVHPATLDQRLRLDHPRGRRRRDRHRRPGRRPWRRDRSLSCPCRGEGVARRGLFELPATPVSYIRFGEGTAGMTDPPRARSRHVRSTRPRGDRRRGNRNWRRPSVDERLQRHVARIGRRRIHRETARLKLSHDPWISVARVRLRQGQQPGLGLLQRSKVGRVGLACRHRRRRVRIGARRARRRCARDPWPRVGIERWRHHGRRDRRHGKRTVVGTDRSCRCSPYPGARGFGFNFNLRRSSKSAHRLTGIQGAEPRPHQQQCAAQIG